LPIICDPSHICGNKELIPYVAQKAMDLDFDGLMIETHISPQVALSDAEQQVTPSQLQQIVKQLTIRQSSIPLEEENNPLQLLRDKISQIDDELLLMLSKRMTIAEQIGKFKKQNNLTILQVNRWEEILKNQLRVAEAMGLNKEFTKNIYTLIHDESIRKQSEIMNA
jgi:chorismate mutase